MKRLPLFVSFIAVVALSASLAYWALQLFTPPQRPLAAASIKSAPEASVDAAAGLFGGQAASVVVSQYKLKGVIAAANGRGSVAILSIDDKPARALPVGAEVVPGVTVKEVKPRFVLLSESGAVQRVDLAVDAAKPGDAAAGALTPVLPAPVQPIAPARPVVPPQVPLPPPAPPQQPPPPPPPPQNPPPQPQSPPSQQPSRMTLTPTTAVPAPDTPPR